MDSKIECGAGEEYEPPVIEDIPLHSGENLLAGCKTPDGLGPGRSGSQNHFCGLCRTTSAS